MTFFKTLDLDFLNNKCTKIKFKNVGNKIVSKGDNTKHHIFNILPLITVPSLPLIVSEKQEVKRVGRKTRGCG